MEIRFRKTPNDYVRIGLSARARDENGNLVTGTVTDETDAEWIMEVE